MVDRWLRVVEWVSGIKSLGRVRVWVQFAKVAVVVGSVQKGIIRTPDEDYIIEPLVDHVIPDLNGQPPDAADESHHLPHKLYKRSAMAQQPSTYCGVKDKGKLY